MSEERPQINSKSRLAAYKAAIETGNATVRDAASEELSKVFNEWVTSPFGSMGELRERCGKTPHINWTATELALEFISIGKGCHKSVIESVRTSASTLGYIVTVEGEKMRIVVSGSEELPADLGGVTLTESHSNVDHKPFDWMKSFQDGRGAFEPPKESKGDDRPKEPISIKEWMKGQRDCWGTFKKTTIGKNLETTTWRTYVGKKEDEPPKSE